MPQKTRAVLDHFVEVFRRRSDRTSLPDEPHLHRTFIGQARQANIGCPRRLSVKESGMDAPISDKEVGITPDTPRTSSGHEESARSSTRVPAMIVGIVAAVVAGLSIFYLLRPEPLLVQGEV